MIARLPFDNLPELTAKPPGTGGPVTDPPPETDTDTCCCVTLDPTRANEIQTEIDKFSGVANASIKFEPGEYVLREPLRIDRGQNGLLLEACTGANVVFRAETPTSNRFSAGMFVLAGCKNVTLRGLEFEIPVVPVTDLLRKRIGGTDYGLPVDRKVETTSVGVYLRRVIGVTIERCTFEFSANATNCFGAAILVHDNTSTVTLSESTIINRRKEVNDVSVFNGVLVVPLALGDNSAPIVGILDGLSLDANRFSGLSHAALVAADGRAVSARNNMARGCDSGLLYFDMPRDGKAYDRLQAPVGTASDPGFEQTNEFVKAVLQSGALCDTLVYSTVLWPEDLAPDKITFPQASKAVPLALDVIGNDWSCVPVNEDAESRIAVLIWDLYEDSTSAVTVTTNRVWNRSVQVPTMMVLMASRTNVTGNVLTNALQDPGTYGEGKPGSARFALLIVPGGREPVRFTKSPINMFTATGNTMTGSSNLKLWVRQEWADRLPKSLVALLTWDFFNTET